MRKEFPSYPEPLFHFHSFDIRLNPPHRFPIHKSMAITISHQLLSFPLPFSHNKGRIPAKEYSHLITSLTSPKVYASHLRQEKPPPKHRRINGSFKKVYRCKRQLNVESVAPSCDRGPANNLRERTLERYLPFVNPCKKLYQV